MVVLIHEIEQFLVEVLTPSPEFSAQVFERLVPVVESREECCGVSVGGQEGGAGERFGVGEVVV